MNYIADDMSELSIRINKRITDAIKEEIEDSDLTKLNSMFFILRVENPDKTCDEDATISITNSKAITKEEFNALSLDIAHYIKTILEDN
jgi:hypothetical protein